MSHGFPNELKQFIAQNVESLAQLEALLLMRENSQRQWSSAEVAQRLYITTDMCEGILADLVRRGFAERADGDGSYRYRPTDDAVDQLVSQLATLYQQRRVAVITEIYSKPVNKVQTFANAFRLRREDE